jgi:hypothetical protein
MTKDTTRPMTAEEYWEEEAIQNVDPFTSPFKFAEAYADYRLRFEQEQQPQPLDPFEGAPEWAEWRAADANGNEFFYSLKTSPIANCHVTDGFCVICPDRRLTYSDWRQSPVKRKR